MRPSRLLLILAVALLVACEDPPPEPPPPTATVNLAQAPRVTTASGLQFIELVPGTGDPPKPGDVVEINYRAMLADGTQFESSYSRGSPMQFVLGVGAVIAGWDEGVAMMRKGGQARLIIPPNLAYGERGSGGVIPPNATLTYDLELADIRPAAPAAPTQLEVSQYITTPSGLRYADLSVGSGAEASAGKAIAVHYTGWLTDGTRIDTSREPKMPMGRQKPYGFTLGQGKVIAGWDEGIVGMRVGGKRQLVIPANLAYGERGRGAAIPPNATLVFEIELIEVND